MVKVIGIFAVREVHGKIHEAFGRMSPIFTLCATSGPLFVTAIVKLIFSQGKNICLFIVLSIVKFVLGV